MSQTPVPSQAVQQVIRYAMLGGILVFGAVIAWLWSSGMLSEPAIDGNRSPVAIALSVLVLASIGSIPLFHRLIRAAASGPRRFQLTLAGLAVCEAAALAGGVLWILSGSWTMYAVGAGVFVVAMIWLRDDEPEGEA